ncbi:MAG: antibiotic biosynthesis monooxygenase [Geminicoccaceae bacterium]|jgi:quinol monooxygenase YgiN|nr:antibiotic biosynthesis monooxygenase [Geminicoccaceae bacterium]HRY22866.1 antibiotic biosynthesis monooxygenase [Geminicoccaceae bacterium]
MEPVHVMAVIEAKPGKRAELLAAFKANVPAVHAEDGCIVYEATVDTEAAGPIQNATFGADTFVVVEKWASLEALEAHAAAPHMKSYGERVKDLIAERTIYVLSPA